MSTEQTGRSRIAAIVIILLLRSMSTGIVGLALPLYFAAVGRSPGEWGLAAGVFALATVFGEPFWGWQSDRLGLAAPFLAAGLGAALLVPALGLTANLAALLALQLGRGAVETGSAPAARKALAHSLGPGKRAAGIGLFQACNGAGIALGPIVAGWLLERLGYQAAFLACSALSLTAVALTLWSRPVLSSPLQAPEGDAGLPAGAPDAGPPGPYVRAFIALAAVAVCLFAGTAVGRSFLPLLGTEMLGLDASPVALMLGVTGALGGPLTILCGSLADRWGRLPLIAAGLLCVAGGLLGCAAAPSLAALGASAFLLTLGSAAGIPAGVALISDVTPVSRQDRMIGLYGACENLGITIGPVLCGLVWDARGPRLALVVCALFVLLGLPLLLRGVRPAVQSAAAGLERG
jgi:MFS family permease